MTKTSMIKRIGGCVVVAAALAVPATASGMAIYGPACTTALVSPVNASPSCGFDSPTNWSTITVEPVVGSVTATVRCSNLGTTTITSQRTVSQASSWRASAYGTCNLTLTAATSGAVATGQSTPTIPPIYPTP